jgi:Tfp pilus assembly protein PilO
MLAVSSNKTNDVLDPEIRRFGWVLHSAGFTVTLLCGVIGYTWVYERAETNMVQLAASIRELRTSVQSASEVRHTHEELSKRLEDLRTRMDTLQRRVPHDADAGKFLREVSTIARDESLDISNFEPDKAVSREGFMEMEVTLTGQGDFKSICSFLDRLNKLSRLSKVKDLSISTSGTEEMLPMKATLVIYFGLRGPTKPSPKEVQNG